MIAPRPRPYITVTEIRIFVTRWFCQHPGENRLDRQSPRPASVGLTGERTIPERPTACPGGTLHPGGRTGSLATGPSVPPSRTARRWHVVRTAALKIDPRSCRGRPRKQHLVTSCASAAFAVCLTSQQRCRSEDI